MLEDAEANHLSWFGRGRRRVDLEGVRVFLGGADAVLAFPHPEADLPEALHLARESGAREIGCWSLRPHDGLDARLLGLGFQDGWQPHWMGLDPRVPSPAPRRAVERTNECAAWLPYASASHGSCLGDDVHHFLVRDEATPAGHAILNVDRATATGGIYDMGVAPTSRRRGLGTAPVHRLTLAGRVQGDTRASGCATGGSSPPGADGVKVGGGARSASPAASSRSGSA